MRQSHRRTDGQTHRSQRTGSANSVRVALGIAALLCVSASVRLSAQSLRVPHETFTLANGLKVILHEDHSVPIVTVNTWYHAGSGDERAGRTGFAHLFEHIMFMGSQHVPTGDFDRLLEAAGANNNGSTTEDRTNYYEDGPAGALELMLWLDSDRMGFLLPEITPEKVDIQRGVVQNERRQSYENQPYGLAEENIISRLFPAGHPYSWPVIGSMTDLTAATIEDVRDFFRRYYAPNNATMVIAGDINRQQAREWVERYFGDIPRGPEIQRNTVQPFRLERNVLHTLEDRVQLPRVYDAWHSVRGFHDDDAALDVLASILAGGRSSRLYRRLVYDLQIATQVTAYNESGRLDGKFVIYATARPDHDLPELQRVIDEEVRRLAADGPTARELQRVKNQTEAQFLGAMERVGGFGGKADRLNSYDYFVGQPDYFEQDLDRYRRVSAADVQRVARQYLAQANRVVLSVVPTGRQNLAVTEGGTP